MRVFRWRHVLCAVVLTAGAPLFAAGDAARAAEDPLGRARALVEARRAPEAKEPLEELLRREPENLEAILLLARVYDLMGRRDAGIELLDPAAAAHPNDARVIGFLGGQCLLRADELGAGFRALRLARRGRDLLERAVTLAPANIAYREGLVDFYRQAPALAGGSKEKARSHAAAITKLDPVRGAAWMAAILVEEGDHAGALASCDAALAARPDDYLALITLGRTVSSCGLRLEDGEKALRRCLAMTPSPSEPSHAAVWYHLGVIAEKRGDTRAAREAYEESSRLEPLFNRPAEALRRLKGE